LVILDSSEPEVRNTIFTLKVINFYGLIFLLLVLLSFRLGCLFSSDLSTLLLKFLESIIELWNEACEFLQLTLYDLTSLFIDRLLLSFNFLFELLDFLLKFVIESASSI
jgi:hypothetical protein